MSCSGAKARLAPLLLAAAATLACRAPNPAFSRPDLPDGGAHMDTAPARQDGPAADLRPEPSDTTLGDGPSLDASPDLTPPPSDGPTAPEGLVARWRLDDGVGSSTAADDQRQSNGVLTDMDPQQAWITGLRGTALRFAPPGYVSVPVAAPLERTFMTGKFTVALSAAVNQVFRANESLISRQISGSDNAQFGIFLISGRYRLFVAAADGRIAECTAADPAFVEAWVSLALVLDGTRARLYVGGGEVCSVPWSGLARAEPTPLMIGGRNWGNQQNNDAPWSGRLDDVMIFDRALTAAELRSL